uniref:Uncharacterized protein n=1 Tax=Rangifer tarandus platyrhynchus TaxID=3082113 RepID=A0ACB0EZF8_RANTA|nr:unnamed protein product [Rangifer tarandus platyrhynchus]
MTSSPLPRMPLVWGLSPKPAHPLGKEESRNRCSGSQISASQEAAGLPAGSCGGNVQGALSCSRHSEDQAPEPQQEGTAHPRDSQVYPHCAFTHASALSYFVKKAMESAGAWGGAPPGGDVTSASTVMRSQTPLRPGSSLVSYRKAQVRARARRASCPTGSEEGHAAHWTPAAGPLLLLCPRSTEPGARRQPLTHDPRAPIQWVREEAEGRVRPSPFGWFRVSVADRPV